MRNATLLALVALVTLVALACGGDGEEPSATSVLDGESPFPVVLEHDTLVVASADGSGITETPVEYRPRPAALGYVSPQGGLTASYRDGTLFMQKDGGEAKAIAELPTDAEFATTIWSLDGRRLLIDASFRGDSPSLYLINADGSGLTDVGAGLEGDAFPMSWSPDGQRFAMGLYTPEQQSVEGLDALLYVVRADGTERTLTGDFSNFHGYEGIGDLAKWSPDGSRIAVFAPPSEGAIRLMDASGGPPVDIPGSSFPAFSWSPDSRLLALERRPPGGGDSSRSITVVDIASPGESRLLTVGFWPRWSPDGERIAFKRDGQVYTIRPDGSDLVSLADMGPEARSDLIWSADGDSVQFIRSAPAAQYLYAVDLRTGEAVRSPEPLTDAPFIGPRRNVRLSPNGDQIAFSRDAFETTEGDEGAGWFTMDILTGELTRITHDTTAGDVFWSADGVARLDGTPPGQLATTEAGGDTAARSPDGETVAFLRLEDAEGELWLVAADGSNERRIALFADVGLGFGPLYWSSDGERIAVLVASRDIYVIEVETGASLLVATNVGNCQMTLVGWSPDGEVIYAIPACALGGL